MSTESKNRSVVIYQTKSFCTEKELKSEKASYEMREHICKLSMDKGVIYKLCKKLIQLKSKGTNNLIKNELRS